MTTNPPVSDDPKEPETERLIKRDGKEGNYSKMVNPDSSHRVVHLYGCMGSR